MDSADLWVQILIGTVSGVLAATLFLELTRWAENLRERIIYFSARRLLLPGVRKSRAKNGKFVGEDIWTLYRSLSAECQGGEISKLGVACGSVFAALDSNFDHLMDRYFDSLVSHTVRTVLLSLFFLTSTAVAIYISMSILYNSPEKNHPPPVNPLEEPYNSDPLIETMLPDAGRVSLMPIRTFLNFDYRGAWHPNSLETVIIIQDFTPAGVDVGDFVYTPGKYLTTVPNNIGVAALPLNSVVAVSDRVSDDNGMMVASWTWDHDLEISHSVSQVGTILINSGWATDIVVVRANASDSALYSTVAFTVGDIYDTSQYHKYWLQDRISSFTLAPECRGSCLQVHVDGFSVDLSSLAANGTFGLIAPVHTQYPTSFAPTGGTVGWLSSSRTVVPKYGPRVEIIDSLQIVTFKYAAGGLLWLATDLLSARSDISVTTLIYLASPDALAMIGFLVLIIAFTTVTFLRRARSYFADIVLWNLRRRPSDFFDP